MDFEFPPDTLMLRDMLRRFVEKDAMPLEMQYFTSGELKPEERRRLKTAIDQMGLWGIMVPEEFGGGGLDTVTACLLEEELGKTFLPVETGDIPPLLYACRDGQVEQFLQPAVEGSRRLCLAMREPDRLRPEEWTCEAVPEGEGYLLRGIKVLSVSPGADNFLVVFARSPEGMTAFILEVDQPGMRISRNGEVLLHLEDCRVSTESILGEPGQALLLGAEEAPRAWVRLGARYVGFAQRLADMSAAYTRDWVVFGVPLSERPAVLRMLAELNVQIESTRWLVYHAAWQVDRQDSLRVPAAQVRLAAGEMLQKAIDMVTLVYGGPGPTPQIELQRIVHTALPVEALQVGLEGARLVLAREMLASSPVGSSSPAGTTG